MRATIAAIALLVVLAAPLAAEESLYRVIALRAAPGEMADWLDNWDDIRAAYVERGDPAPFVLRHSQGDHWDFLLIEPWGSFESYLGAERMARRHAAGEAMETLRRWLDDAPAFREDLLALGPDPTELEALFEANGFYHVEMFHALPYKRRELVEQRRMENDYLARTGQVTNTIWTGVSGSDVDVFTIGFHRDHAAFAAGSSMTEAERDAAARKAGFEGLDHIAPYLRSLISRHQDTLAVDVN